MNAFKLPLALLGASASLALLSAGCAKKAETPPAVTAEATPAAATPAPAGPEMQKVLDSLK